ncbi:MAG TPA: metallopeptidase TldD-related protein [Patescibacteria group bacterium]|nr:metallopeptidase TldD-related protein [Patescibacteria group bacterium]
MIDAKTLQNITQEGLKLLKKEKGLLEGVVYASSNERTIGRIYYTTHIPSTGLEEPKSDVDYGVNVEIWFKKNGKKLIGMGHEPNDMSISAVKRAIVKAKRDAVEDTEFGGFLKKHELPKMKNKTDNKKQKLLSLTSGEETELLVQLSWDTIAGAVDALSAYAKEKKQTPKQLAFILNGDNFIIKERMALATTNGIVDSDETALVLSFLTAMLEKDNAKGSAWGAHVHIDDDFSAYDIGKHAALAAIDEVGGIRTSSGKYNVVFGHQAITELFGSLLAPHMNLGMVDLGASMFAKKYGQKVASELLTLYDDATLPGGAGSKRITCEGYPTGKTALIDHGRLVGYMTDYRTMNKILQNKKHGKEVLGVDPHEIRNAINPQNGFRFARGGGRVAASAVGVYATNLVIESSQSVTPDELLKEVRDGIFIGRLWYTYPIGGYASGIISGTAIADCFTIKNGKLDQPILPNTLRIEDNLGEMIQRIIGIANNQLPTINWASDEITHAPWVGMKDVQFYAINEEKKKTPHIVSLSKTAKKS